MQTGTSTQFFHNILVSNSNRNNYNPALFSVAPHWWWFRILPLEDTNSQNLKVPWEPIELSPMSPSVVAAQSCLEPGYPRSRTTWKSLFSCKMISVWMWALFLGAEGNAFSYYYSRKASRFGSPAVKPGSHVKGMVGSGCRLPWYCPSLPCGAGLKVSPCWDQRRAW